MSGYHGSINLTLNYSDPGPDLTQQHSNIEALLTYQAVRGVWSVLLVETLNLLKHPGLIRAEVRLPDDTRLAGRVIRLSAQGNAFDLAVEGHGRDGQL